MIVAELSPGDRQYPVVVVGTGFGSLFFVHRLLQLKPNTKVLILERGALRPWEQQVEEGRNSDISSDILSGLRVTFRPRVTLYA